MATYRQVHVSFWHDSFVIDLTPEDKFFMLYLLTNPHTTQVGIYELPIKLIETETGYNRETVEKLLERFDGYGKIKYSKETREIVIINWLKYNFIDSSKVKVRMEKDLENVKNKKLIPYAYGIDRLSEEREEEREEEEKENKNKNNKEKKKLTGLECQSILDYYNATCQSLPKAKSLTKTRITHVNARYQERSLDDIKTVIEKTHCSNFLSGRIKGKTWKASFDWIINASNFIKILEGNYDENSEITTKDIQVNSNFDLYEVK